MVVSILRIDHYGDTEDQNRRMTLSPSNICGLAAEMDDTIVQGRSLRRVGVMMMDGEEILLVVNHADLALMERAVGSFIEAE